MRDKDRNKREIVKWLTLSAHTPSGPARILISLADDYFVTCDDKIIRKYTGKVIGINPVGLTMYMLQQEVDNADR
jgi:hypothetical protein